MTPILFDPAAKREHRYPNFSTLLVGILAVVLVAALGRGNDPNTNDDPPGASPGTSVAREKAWQELAEASGFGDPAAVVVPSAAEPARVVSWFEGEGSAAVDLVSRSEPLWRSGREACERTATNLDMHSPMDVQIAIVGIPDEPTTEILSGLFTATASALSACGDAAGFDKARAELAWQWMLADRRLGELGVQR